MVHPRGIRQSIPVQLRIALLILLALGLYLLANGRTHMWDRDEGWYAQIASEMLKSDPPNWTVPRFLGEVFTGKPVLAFWCQAGAMALLGVGPFPARLPSAVATALTLALVAVVVGKTIGWRRALWTVLVLASSALVVVTAKMCLTDAVLMLWVTAAQACLGAIYLGRASWPVVLGMWLAVGLAVLTKGPVVFGVQGMTLLALAAMDVGRRWRSPAAWAGATKWWWRARPLVGALVLVATVTPWVYAVHRKQPDYLGPTVVEDILVPIFSQPLQNHSGPPGYYLAMIWPCFLPWSLLLPLAIVRGWKNRRLPALRFALAATVGPWLVLEIVRQKLPHYLLPIMPPLAFLTADALVRCIRGQYDDLVQPAFLRGAATWAFIAAALGLVPWLAAVPDWEFPRALLLATVLLTIATGAFAALVYAYFRQERVAAAAAAMGLGMMLLLSLAYALYLPNAPYLLLQRRVADALVRHGATRPGDVVAVGYKEPSMAFYQGGTIRLEKRAKRYLNQVPPETWVVASGEVWKDVPSAVGDRFTVVETFRGWNYNAHGKVEYIIVARKK